MQMQELQSTAQETPSPAASRGPQPALRHAVGAGEAQHRGHAQPGTAGGMHSHRQWLENPGNGNSQEKKKKTPHLENRLSHTM